VTLFDGTGQEFTARIIECRRRDVRLQVESSQFISREPKLSITLGVALPKGDRQRWLVEKAVELGVASLVPLVTERSVAQPTAAVTRLERAVIEASKQCGRTRLMHIAQPLGSREFFASLPGLKDAATLRLCAHPAGERNVPTPGDKVVRIRLAIGPEGGFTEDELTSARECGWTPVSLGPRVLRVETAALALAAIFSS
jgi:16S rRNA (uracil1498-N3)-methyltransferase